MVLGVSERWQQPPRGIELNLLVNCTDCGGWVYELQEPDISTLTETSPP